MDMTRMFGALFLLIVQGSLAQRVRVEPEVVSYPGQTVTLRCQFPNPGATQLTQVSWILEPASGDRTNIAVFHPNFGVNYPTQSPVAGRVNFIQNPPTLDNPSIEIRDVKMTDEGRYICEYATYPSGNEQGVSSLVMLAKPRNMADTVTVTAGNTPIVVARCESSNGRPAATISWSTSLRGNVTSLPPTNNPDNTVTVQSEYMLAPQPTDNGKDITCMVSHRTMTQPETFPMKLVVEYPPQVQIVGYDNNWYRGRTNAFLTCQADGNPLPTTVTWRTLSGLMPESVQVRENRLSVEKVDDSINTTFICEVRNRLGSSIDQVTVFVRDYPQLMQGSTTGSIIGGILGVIILLALIGTVVWMVRKRQRKNMDAPPTHKPPPPMKPSSNEDRPIISGPISVYQNTYNDTHGENATTSLSAYYDEGDRHETSQNSPSYTWGQKEAMFPDHDERERDGMQEDDSYFSVTRGSSFMSSAVVV